MLLKLCSWVWKGLKIWLTIPHHHWLLTPLQNLPLASLSLSSTTTKTLPQHTETLTRSLHHYLSIHTASEPFSTLPIVTLNNSNSNTTAYRNINTQLTLLSIYLSHHFSVINTRGNNATLSQFIAVSLLMVENGSSRLPFSSIDLVPPSNTDLAMGGRELCPRPPLF